MVHVLRISKLQQNSDISESEPFQGGDSLSDTVNLSSVKLSYISLCPFILSQKW